MVMEAAIKGLSLAGIQATVPVSSPAVNERQQNRQAKKSGARRRRWCIERSRRKPWPVIPRSTAGVLHALGTLVEVKAVELHDLHPGINEVLHHA